MLKKQVLVIIDPHAYRLLYSLLNLVIITSGLPSPHVPHLSTPRLAIIAARVFIFKENFGSFEVLLRAV